MHSQHPYILTGLVFAVTTWSFFFYASYTNAISNLEHALSQTAVRGSAAIEETTTISPATHSEGFALHSFTDFGTIVSDTEISAAPSTETKEIPPDIPQEKMPTEKPIPSTPPPSPQHTHVVANIQEEKLTVAETALEHQVLSTYILATINAARDKKGLIALTQDDTLVTIATSRSTDMVKRNYFSHTSPDGCTFDCSFLASGYPALSWGENIGWYAPYTEISSEKLSQSLVHDWLLSKGHRANILSETFTHIGVGVATDGNKIIVTTTFATPE